MKGKHGHRQSQRNGAHIDMNVMLKFLLILLKSVSTCKYLHFMLDTVIFFTDHWQISGGSDRNAHPQGSKFFQLYAAFGKKIGQIIAFYIHLWSWHPHLREILNLPLHTVFYLNLSLKLKLNLS